MNFQLEIEIDETIENCKEFFTKKTVGQFIYNTIKAIDELEEISNPNNYQAEELDAQYNELAKYQGIRKKLYNL